MRLSSLVGAFAALSTSFVHAATTWKSVKIGGGGGFVPGIVFSTAKKGVAFARTDIGGLYRLNADDSWTPLQDWVDDARWNQWGVDALALDPVDSNKLYVAVGMYTISWDPNNGSILRSTDLGNTWTAYPLPFKVGGNMPGRGLGERLAIDPNLPTTLYFGARSGNGLWKSTNSGATWAKVTAFPSVGTYVQDPSNEYGADIVGISWVTFDKASGSSGTATPRIFVGVANLGSTNIYVSTNGGSTWSAVAGQPTTYIPHKGVISTLDNTLYVSYADGAGPYDGTLGAVFKYNLATGAWTDITPVTGSDLYFGFGGLDVDRSVAGTLMVASLNAWWPDGNIFRSLDGGATWSRLWSWAAYPTMSRYYSYDVSLAPWIGVTSADETKQIGWMMEGLSIDPFDSNHWLYGTGLTVYGGHDLKKWDTTHNITLKSLADGIEEFAVLGLISPPVGPNLLSAIGDVGGFVHNSLTSAPATPFTNPRWATALDLDYAGNKPTNIVRIGNDASSTGGKQVALSSDSGATWSVDYGAPDLVAGGKVAISADADTVLWRTGSNGVLVSQYTNAFTAVSSLPADVAIASDKVKNTNFYAASANKFYVSTNTGASFTVSAGTLGSSTSANDIVVHPTVTGDVWVSTSAGLFHTTNSGATFTTISGFSAAYSISVGAPKVAGGYPSIYVIGTYGGVQGVYRSDDQGVNFVKINDAAHGFGTGSANVISGDRRIYGRVYVGTNGRGIFYGDASGTDPTPTASVSSTASTTTKASTTVTTSTTSKASTSSTTSKASTTSTTSKASTTSTTSKATTSSSSTTSKTTATTTSSASTATQTHYGQCGGSSWTGPTVCASPYVCTFSNAFYSQCL